VERRAGTNYEDTSESARSTESGGHRDGCCFRCCRRLRTADNGHVGTTSAVDTSRNSGGLPGRRNAYFGAAASALEKNASATVDSDGDNISEELNAAGAVQERYTYGPGIDEPLVGQRQPKIFYYEADGLGSVTSLTDPTGAVEATYTYDSFGFLTNSTGSATNWFRYTGRQFDSNTALYYYRARYYDPVAGRFLSEDPARFSAGVNFYAYVQNNPLDFTDPFVLCGAGKNQPQTPRQAATQYCQQHGQLSFNIPFTHIPVTISLSATLGPANYSATNDINAVFPVFPWPEWLAAGAGVDFTINAPAQPTANPSVGLGKNLSLGYFTSHNGPQGISLSLGPSIGPPINVAVPTNNACGMLAGGS
jgi:RHS repeat-associated protein